MIMNIVIILMLGLIGLTMTLAANRLDTEEYQPQTSRSFKTGKLTYKGDR